MKVLFCSSEIVPFAKTGGLADVAGALPLALEDLGIEVRISMPKYKGIQSTVSKIGKNIICHFIPNDKYYNRDGLYGTKAGDHPDNLDRFSFYCRQTLELIKTEGFKPDIIHCNDWQTSLIPVYLNSIYQDDRFYQRIKTVLTIHNLAYQGVFAKQEFSKTGLGPDLFNQQALKFYNQVNLLKGGIVFSDLITTVSPTYSQEIQSKEFGAGLEGILKKRTKDLKGILNGLDYKIWDPSSDELIFKKYSARTIKDKLINKTKLQEKCNLKQDACIPVIGIVSRLADQKGFDLLAQALTKLCKLPLQLIILGTGEQRYHTLLGQFSSRFKSNLSVNLCFDNALAHQIYAGSDFFLMPSRYEPCGLGQMISLKYATIPIVYNTGGLADTIIDFDARTNKGNGFVFRKYSARALIEALNRALVVFKKDKLWSDLINRATTYDFSWKVAAKNYIELYKKVTNN